MDPAAGKPWNTPAYPLPTFTFNSTQFWQLHDYARDAGWQWVIGINALVRTAAGSWNSTNFESLLRFVQDNKAAVAGWELSNELDIDNKSVTPQQLALDFVHLRHILSTAGFEGLLIGPDIGVKAPYLRDFCWTLQAQPSSPVIDRATFHHYYGNSAKFNLSDFVNATVCRGDDLEDSARTGRGVVYRRSTWSDGKYWVL